MSLSARRLSGLLRWMYGVAFERRFSDGNLITFDNGSTHYWAADVEQFLGEHEADE